VGGTSYNFPLRPAGDEIYQLPSADKKIIPRVHDEMNDRLNLRPDGATGREGGREGGRERERF
jgi:hypothetical protein